MEQLNTKLTTRLALPEEALTVLNLWQESARWLNSKEIYQWRPEYFDLEQVIEFMNDGSDVYLAEMNNEVVGTYTLTWSDPLIWKELDNPDSGYIHRFAVNRDFKGQHIGLLLLKSAEENIRHKGKVLIRLDCMADNLRLNQYYKDYGFQYIRRVELGSWSASLYEKQ
ncbi:GNAT family N-acetyltransferase [Paenibacillus sp. UMB7766-LJ446]|uniref:GNAT family N-acetyltransferase n=1 Tax=Paenibacillus sp. UMB7766-LJ446 TaxID=3046313 RepID=UPI002550A7FD|nr:GNAT family N-acetyltransferase [Paenibacillus sp. UMB7766-LJ446]MDK8189166.1 GNAT family N-acetyltransferase [Paenibacillus sp. UMB7766-LJ446]